MQLCFFYKVTFIIQKVAFIYIFIFIIFFIESSITFCSGKKKSFVSGQKKFVCYLRPYLLNLTMVKSNLFKESDRFGKVHVNPLMDLLIFVEYLSGKGQLSLLFFTVYVVLGFGL